jgi:ATP-binding cassette subfamily F protein uup
MDEPTNDLDTESLELLEERLVDYEGTVLVVSHDRSFLDNVVTSTIVFEEEGVKEYVGGYDDWLRQRQSGKKIAAQADASKKANTSNASAKSNSSPSQLPAEVAASGKKMSFKEKQERDKLPIQIEQYEAEQRSIHAKMAEPEYFKKAQAQIVKDQRRLTELDDLLVQSYARLEEYLTREA